MKYFNRATFGLSIFIALLCLQGCEAKEMHSTPEHVQKYMKACDKNGGVKLLFFNTNRGRDPSHVIDRVQCNDGAVFDSTIINKKA